MTLVPKMIGKSFEAVVYVLCIGLLQHVAFGCQTNSDCRTGSTTTGNNKCCYYVDPPRCMDWLTCYLYRKDLTKPTPPVRFTLPDYYRYTLPDRSRFSLPDYKELNIPKINDNDNNGYYNYDDSDHSSGHSSGATIGTTVSVVVVLAILITCLRWVRYRPTQRHLQRNCRVPPPAPTNTSRRGNLVVQQNEEQLSRIVIIAAVTREEDHTGRQNRPPDGEPPFLSEEDILSNLHNSCAQEPPSYEETIEGPHQFPQGLDNTAIDVEPPPAYSHLQATPLPNINPPTYEEALASNN